MNRPPRRVIDRNTLPDFAPVKGADPMETIIAPFTQEEWISWARWVKETHGLTNSDIQRILKIGKATDWKRSLDEATAAIEDHIATADAEPDLDPGNDPPDPEPQPEPTSQADYAPGTVFHHTGMVSTEIELNGYRFVIDARGGDTPEMIASRFEALIGGLKIIGKTRQGIQPYHLKLLTSAQQQPEKPDEPPPTKSREYYAFKRFVDGDEKTITLPYYHELSGKEAQHPDIVSKQGHRLFDKAMEEAGLKLADYEHGKTVKMKIIGTWKQGKLMEKKKPEDPDQYYRTWIGFTITP